MTTSTPSTPTPPTTVAPYTKSLAAAGTAAFPAALLEELTGHAKQIEPILMRHAGGWLDGPVHYELLSFDDAADPIRARVIVSYRSAHVPGCGTSALATDTDVAADLTIDRASGRGTFALVTT